MKKMWLPTGHKPCERIGFVCLLALMWLMAAAPLATAVTPPADAEVSTALGSLTITTYNPVTITGLEYSTNLYFTLTNPTAQAVTVSVPDPETMSLPEWAFHFFAFQSDSVVVPAGGTATAEYVLTNEDQGQAGIPFTFTIPATGQTATVNIDLISTSDNGFDSLSRSATVTGTVRAEDGSPVAGAEVRFYLFNGRSSYTTQTNEAGLYSLAAPTLSDLQTALGSRRLPYHSLGYYLTVEAEGYRFGYQGEIHPTTGQTAIVDFSLPEAEEESYEQIGQIASDGVHGYWWLAADATFDNIYGVQARHPSALELPGHVIGLTAGGALLFQVTTSDECWGFDRSTDGNLAAGCNDGSVYLIDSSGNLLWSADAQSMNREIRFSPDGTRIFTGPWREHRTALLDLNGQVIWGFNPIEQWLRHSRFSPDGQRIAAGFSAGAVSLLDIDGNEIWRNHIGEFPLMIALDSAYNFYGGGKNREVFAFDASGSLRWRRRVGNHVISAGAANFSQAGDLLVFGTVGGFLIAYDSSGNIKWQRPIGDEVMLQGHNACYITPDGSRIVVGGNDGSINVFDAHGTKLWTRSDVDVRDPSLYDHNQTGAIAVIMSDDGLRLAAGYGDSVIRVFEREGGSSNDGDNNPASGLPLGEGP